MYVTRMYHMCFLNSHSETPLHPHTTHPIPPLRCSAVSVEAHPIHHFLRLLRRFGRTGHQLGGRLACTYSGQGWNKKCI